MQVWLEGYKSGSKPKHVAAYGTASFYAQLGEQDQAFEWLEQAYQERSMPLVYLKVDPDFDALRFQDLLHRMNFPE